MKSLYLSVLVFMFFSINANSQVDTTVYHLVINQETVNKADKEIKGMTINGGIPGPSLYFTEGDYAVIYVKNEMDVETSIHWHGMILPNFQDGVPYLTTPPIKAGSTFRYEFPIKQSGTYWYHSHTMLQEQSGVYGALVIEPKEEVLNYDKELVMVLSDWTNQKPANVLRNLKRGNEWYQIAKGTAVPLNRVIKQRGLGAQLNFWRQRMEGADIADVYYPAFLINGQQKQHYPQFKSGEKIRLRIINASASSQYWMTFGGEDPFLVAADGQDVIPIKRNKTFIAIAETYDFIVKIPNSGLIEFRAMAQDGSGNTFAYLGDGDTLKAPIVPRPDKITMMKQMAKMDMRMGAPAMKFNPGKENPHKMKNNWGMKMDKDMSMPEKNDENMHMSRSDSSLQQMEGIKHNHEKGNLFAKYNYDYLKATEKTSFSKEKPINDVLLNLTGNMWRYIWSINGVPLAKADKIKVKEGEVLRITLNNLTMMHHPMHLHGHFFRVINDKGEYSPLKHTVNVPPMQKVVIEFEASEFGDWFFHCHVLYHMISGMARIYSYENFQKDPRMKEIKLKHLTNEGRHFYNWGMIDVASHMTELNLVSSNTRNQFNITAEYGWNQNLEAEASYEYYLYDYFRVFGGINIENEIKNSLGELSATAIGGFRFFTPYMFNLDVRIDNQLRPQIGLSRSIMIFPKTVLFGEYEYQADFGWVNDLEDEKGNSTTYKDETVWQVGLEYLLSRNFSIMASYDNRFGAGGGLSAKF